MDGRSRVRRLAAVLALAGMVGGCSAGATQTAQGGAVATTASAVPTGLTPSGAASWGYVPIGDSIMVTVSPHYELMVDQSNPGVTLTIPVRSLRPGAHSDEMLAAIRSDLGLRDAIRNARLILIQVPVGEFVTCQSAFEAASKAAIDACLDPVITQYAANADATFAEIMGLRSPSAAVRAIDLYEEGYGLNIQGGIHQWLKPYWQRINAAVHSAADRFGVPVARVYDDFMGPTGDNDPVASGMIQADFFHPTWDGAEEIATLLDTFKYEPTPVKP